MQSGIVPVLALAVAVGILFKLASQYDTLATPIASAATRTFSHTLRYGPPSACSPPSPSASPSTATAPSATTPVASPRCASSVRERDVTACACRVLICDVQASTSASALTPSTPPATPPPPSARVSPSALPPSCHSPSSPRTPCALRSRPPRCVCTVVCAAPVLTF